MPNFDPASYRIRGTLSPVLTPFNTDLSPSVPRFIRHCQALMEQDVGLAVFGTNSEATSLSLGEKHAILDAMLDARIPAQRILPGVGACAYADVIELTRHAVNIGCAGVLMLPPFYYKGVSDEGLFRAFSQVIDAVNDPDLRIYLYHIPAVTQVGISLPLIERLLRAFPGTIAGIKDSSGNWGNTLSMMQEFSADGFDVFAGSETQLVDVMREGGAGVISATANVNAKAIAQLYRNWQRPEAEVAQVELNQVRATFAQFPMIAAMKAAVSAGLDDPLWSRVRAPLVELSEQQRETLLSQLAALGFQLYGSRLSRATHP